MAALPFALAALPGSGAEGVATLSLVSALAAALVALSVWLAARRRFPRVAVAAVAMGALLALGAFVPPPAVEARGEIAGTLTGEARVPVDAAPGAPVSVDGGEGRLETDGNGTVLVLSCPQRCVFRAEASVHAPELELRLDGGPMFLKSTTYHCQRLPFVLAWMGGGTPCAPCRETEYLAAEGASGARRVPGTGGGAC